MKRFRSEWDDDPNAAAQKKLSTEETRSRLDEIKMQRPPSSPSTPAYHPSEAAHHPSAPTSAAALPGVQSITQSPRTPPVVYEPAARKMEVDENYDDSGDDGQSATKQESRRGSPKGIPSAAGASATGPVAVEQQA